MVQFREIDRHNFWDVIDLKVAAEQKNFIATNLFSLAQAKAYPECICLAIYAEEVLVGFVMYCIDEDDGEYWIYRLMIDEKYQGKGYGKKAMQKLMALIQEDTSRHVLYLSFEPDNHLAKSLYENLGFEHDGRVIDGEVVYRYTY